eukprot:g6164.t1
MNKNTNGSFNNNSTTFIDPRPPEGHLFMYDERALFKPWTEHWFALRGSILQFWHLDNLAEPEGTLDLKRCTISEDNSTGSGVAIRINPLSQTGVSEKKRNSMDSVSISNTTNFSPKKKNWAGGVAATTTTTTESDVLEGIEELAPLSILTPKASGTTEMTNHLITRAVLSTLQSELNMKSSSKSKQSHSKELIKKTLVGIQESDMNDGASVSGNGFIATAIAPAIFASLREEWGISLSSFMESINGGLQGGAIGEGKSGMLFWKTADSKYTIKTVKRLELDVMRRLLPKYYEHMYMTRRRDQESLLCRFLGLYRIRVKALGDELILVVMENVFLTNDPRITISQKYDLKGSSKNRIISEAELKAGATGKDHNFIANVGKLSIGAPAKTCLITTLRNDATFLERANIVDYSLLLGISEHEANVPCSQRTGSHVIRSLCKKKTYFMAVIDLLQSYNFKKKFETTIKAPSTLVASRSNRDTLLEASGISSVPPEIYSKRFIEFLSNCM